jgi:hypothetical protein
LMLFQAIPNGIYKSKSVAYDDKDDKVSECWITFEVKIHFNDRDF